MSSIDERVVSMKFDNGQFEKGAKQSLGTLDKLKKGLSLEGAKKGLSGLAQSAKNFSLGGIAKGIDNISSKFSALGIMGVTALANIANRAVNAGITIAKSLTLDPIMQGFEEYELKMGSIQTIMSGTGAPLEEVNGYLDELNTYADKTIYSFADMTNSIGKFTNAGVDLDTSVKSIQGISNAAALAGAGSNEASRAMYNFSQALSQGSVRLQDWMSIENANMATAGFREELIKSAVAAGTLQEAGDGVWKTMEGTEVTVENFRNTLADQWLTSEALTHGLEKYADETTELGQAAFAAAQDVKTFTQLMDTLQEAVGSGWARTFELIVGDFEQAKELWTGVSDTLGGMIDGMSDARNDLLEGWADLGGRDVMIEALANAFHALMAIIKPVKDAFSEIFPPLTAQTLYDLTVSLRDFTESLKMGDDTADKLKRTFKGVFAILGIGWEVVKGLFGVFGQLFGVAQEGGASFLGVTAAVGDFLTELHRLIRDGEIIPKIFNSIGAAVSLVAGFLITAGKAVGDFVGSIVNFFKSGTFEFDLDLNPMTAIIEKITARFEGFGRAISWAKDAADTFFSAIKQVWNILAQGDFVSGIFEEDSKIVDWLFKIREMLEEFGGMVKDFFSDFEFDTLLDIFNTGLFAGLVLIVKGFFGDMKDIFSGEGGGIVEKITGVFDGITGSLQAMQTDLKAKTLLKIAGAIAILAAAVLLISLIDSDDLTKSLTAITVMFGQLGGALAVFEKIASGPGMVKMPILAASLILLAIAVNILALAVRQMSDLDWEELAKGLLGVAGVLGLLAGWSKVMEKQQGSLVRASIAMILVGAAVKILASAVGDFSDMSWDDMLQGLAGLGGVLLAVGAFGRLGGGSTLKGALSMVIIGAALKILVPPLEDLGSMDQDTLIQGLIGIAAALLVMAGGMMAMQGSIAGALSMTIVAGALWILVPLLVELGEMSWNEIGKAATMLAGALLIIAGGMYLMTGIVVGAASMLIAVAALWVLVPLLVELGNMSWEDIGKAATMLAGSLLIIAGGMYLMTGALPGAAALIVVSAALAVLTPVLLALSQLSWNELLVGLAALAGVFTVLGLAGLVLTPVVPTLILLGVAIGLMGAGAMLAGAGMLMFATGLTALGVAATVSGVALVGLFKQILGLIPYALEQLGLGIVALANVITEGAPAIVEALVAVIQSLLEAIRTLAPDIIGTVMMLIQLLADTLVENVPMLVTKGLELLLGILRGIRDNIQQIVEVGLEIIENFIKGVENGLPQLVDSAYNAMITFIDELAATIENNQARMEAASRRLAEAIIDALIGGIKSFIGGVKSSWRNNVGNAITEARSNLVSKAKTLASNIVNGLRDKISTTAGRIGSSIRSTIGNALSSATSYVFNRAKNLAGNIISGMRTGITNGASRIASAARTAAGNALDSAKRRLGIKSPSREFMKVGRFSSEGMAIGIESYAGVVAKSAEGVGVTALDSMKKSVANIGSMVESDMDMNPTIRPVLDLSSIRKDAGLIDGLVGRSKIDVGSTYGQAIGISEMAKSDGIGPLSGIQTEERSQGDVIFQQYNNSPKALSNVDIYRQTKNQLSAARGAVARNANLHPVQGRG